LNPPAPYVPRRRAAKQLQVEVEAGATEVRPHTVFPRLQAIDEEFDKNVKIFKKLRAKGRNTDGFLEHVWKTMPEYTPDFIRTVGAYDKPAKKPFLNSQDEYYNYFLNLYPGMTGTKSGMDAFFRSARKRLPDRYHEFTHRIGQYEQRRYRDPIADANYARKQQFDYYEPEQIEHFVEPEPENPLRGQIKKTKEKWKAKQKETYDESDYYSDDGDDEPPAPKPAEVAPVPAVPVVVAPPPKEPEAPVAKAVAAPDAPKVDPYAWNGPNPWNLKGAAEKALGVAIPMFQMKALMDLASPPKQTRYTSADFNRRFAPGSTEWMHPRGGAPQADPLSVLTTIQKFQDLHNGTDEYWKKHWKEHYENKHLENRSYHHHHRHHHHRR
jgi:hypothetical protein